MRLATDKKEAQFLKKLGARIAEVRTDQGMTAVEACAKAGLEKSNWSAIEHGRQNIGVIMLKKIADALNVPISKLTEGL